MWLRDSPQPESLVVNLGRKFYGVFSSLSPAPTHPAPHWESTLCSVLLLSGHICHLKIKLLTSNPHFTLISTYSCLISCAQSTRRQTVCRGSPSVGVLSTGPGTNSTATLSTQTSSEGFLAFTQLCPEEGGRATGARDPALVATLPVRVRQLVRLVS